MTPFLKNNQLSREGWTRSPSIAWEWPSGGREVALVGYKCPHVYFRLNEPRPSHTHSRRTAAAATIRPADPSPAIGYAGLGRLLYLGESGRGWRKSGGWVAVRGAAWTNSAPGVAVHG